MRDVINSRTMNHATNVLEWTLAAGAAAAFAYGLTTGPHESTYYLIPFATAITSLATHSFLNLARYAITQPEKRGNIPLKRASMILLAAAAWIYILNNQAASYICMALVVSATTLTLADSFRKQGEDQQLKQP